MDKLYESIVKQINDARRERQESVKEFAMHCGVSESTIRHLKRPSTYTLSQICKYINIKLADMLTIAEQYASQFKNSE